MSSGTESLSCGARSEALEVFGMSAMAEAKSAAVGVVRRLEDMEVRVKWRKLSISGKSISD